MYSQSDEERWIIEFFGSNIGRFLDIGAYDGITFSNTHRLVELGWSGVCVEPSPAAFMGLMKLYRDNPKVQLVNCVVDEFSHLVKFYDAGGDAVSSIDLNHRVKWENFGGSKFSEIFVKTITTKDLFGVFGYNFDFINIDVENKNFELFRGIDFNNLPRLKAICIEHDNKIKQMTSMAESFGFKIINQNAENIFLVHP